jgi:hypothetical protein
MEDPFAHAGDRLPPGPDVTPAGLDLLDTCHTGELYLRSS